MLFFLVAALFLLTGTANWGLDAATAVRIQEVQPVQVLELQALVYEPQEDPGIDENALIEAALIEQGFLSYKIPLDFTLQDVIQTACAEFGVPYPLALSVMEQESGFQTDAVSASGCYGLMQLNPDYFPADLTPAENIRAGVAYLGELLANSDTTAQAVTAYFYGPSERRTSWYSDEVLARVGAWEGLLCVP